MKQLSLFLVAAALSATTASGQVFGTGTPNFISKWTCPGPCLGATDITNSLLQDNGTTIMLGNWPVLFGPPPSAYMMHIYETGAAGHTIGLDVELFNKANPSKGVVTNIQGSPNNIGFDAYTAGGTSANGGTFVANNATGTNTGIITEGKGGSSGTNIGITALGRDGVNATGGSFVANNATTDNTAVDGVAADGTNATGGNFTASNASTNNIAVAGTATDGTDAKGGTFSATNAGNNNIGVEGTATTGTNATGGTFSAADAANNIGVKGAADRGTNATAGSFIAKDASTTNTGIDAKALNTGSNNFAGRFEAENASVHNYGVHASAENGQNSTGGFLTGAYTPNAKGVLGWAIANQTASSKARGGEFAAFGGEEIIGLMATGTAHNGNLRNYGISATADAIIHGSATDRNYGVYANATANSEVNTNAGVYVKADALGNNTINYGVYSKITGGLAANNPPTTAGAGSYAGYFFEGFPGNTLSAGAAFFNGEVIFTTPGVTSISDKKFKEDINNLDGAIEKIMQLDPKTYVFKSEKEFPSFSFPQGKQFGFIAQDLEKVFPELVNERVNPAQYEEDGKLIADKVTFKGVNYTSLIPILTAGMQEQQKMIEAKDAKINELEERLARLEESINGTGIGNTGTSSKAILFQNTPNPFNGNTEIRYRLSETHTHAEVMIFDMNGKKIKSMALQGNEGAVTVSATDMAAGMYMYSLVMDGEVAATKRMLVN